MSLLKIFCTVSKLMNILLFFYSDGKHSFRSSLNFHHLLRLVQNSNEVLRFKFLVLAWRFIDCNACFALSVRLWHQQTCWAILVTQFSAWIQCSCTWRYQGAGHQVRNGNKQIKKIRETKIKLTKQLQTHYSIIGLKSCMANYKLIPISCLRLKQNPFLLHSSQPPPFLILSKFLIWHGEVKSYCFTASCFPESMFNCPELHVVVSLWFPLFWHALNKI